MIGRSDQDLDGESLFWSHSNQGASINRRPSRWMGD